LAFNKEKSLAAAKRYIQKGHIDKAILEYKRIVEDEPHDAKNLQRLAELYVRQGSRQEAISVFLTLGDLLIRQGFSNRAISIYKQILQLNPLLIPVYIKLSEIFKTLGLSKDARLFNQRAVEIVQKAGSVEDVYKLLVKIIEIDQEDAISRIALAETCLKMKQNKMAIEQFEAALPLLREQHLDDLFIRAAERLLFHKPDNVELCRELAILHMNRKEIPKSMKLLLHCRKLDPEDLETLDLLIAHFLQTQNNEKAVLVLLEKGKLLNKRGDDSEAREVFRKILKIDPSNVEAKKYAPAGEDYAWEDIQPPSPPPPSYDAAAQGATGAPVDSALHDEIAKKFVDEAEIFIKYGLRQKALEHLFKGIEETSGSPMVREKLKDLYLDMGDINLGMEQLFLLSQQLKDSDPGRAAIFLKEILLINPNEPRALKMLESLAGGPEEISLEPVLPLENVIDIPFTEMPAKHSQEDSFLEQETSDLITRIDAMDSIHDLEEPFRNGEVIPPVMPSAEISPEELRALDMETMEEVSTDDVESFDTDSIEEISEVSEISAMDISHLEPVSVTDEIPTDEISTEEYVALETETRDDMFPKTEANGSAAGAPPGKASLELSRGPRSPAIDQVLDEADFFSSQGLAQEALVLLEDLLDQYPGHSLIVEKIAEIRQKSAAAAKAPKPKAAADDGWEPQISVSQVADEALEELGALEKIISPTAAMTEPLENGIIASPSEIDAADAQTHHDLGIAYMEMGLWDQAVGEFRIAAQNLHMEATCYNLIGTCLMNEGSIDDAIKEYKMGLFAREKTPDQEMSLYYDLANAYIQLEDLKEGLYYLQNIKKKNPNYKDVNAKIVELTNAFNATIARQPERGAKKKPAPSTPQDTAKEVDDAFDNLFGDFGKKK